MGDARDMEKPTWPPESETELTLLAKVLTAAEWSALSAASRGEAGPAGVDGAIEHLSLHCDALGFAALVVRDGPDLRLNVEDPSWAIRALDLGRI